MKDGKPPKRDCGRNSEPDGCKEVPAGTIVVDGNEIPEHTECFCSEDMCNDYPEKKEDENENQKATKCYNGDKDPPKETADCFKPKSKCWKAIWNDGKLLRGCGVDSVADGCKEIPAMTVEDAEGNKINVTEHTECLCSGDKCNDYPEKPKEKKPKEKKNVASCILPSYMLWISHFVAATWCKHAFESL